MALIEKKIRLDVTSAVENYVAQYGAKYDKECKNLEYMVDIRF